MPWSHCGQSIRDDDSCPGCGIKKSEWTIQFEQVRTLTVRRKKRDAWIAVQLLDLAGEPMPGAPYRIRLHDGRVQEGELDAEGKVRLEELAPGTCEVEFPDLLPEPAERPTGALHVFQVTQPFIFSY